jgi:hypothetical protein
MRRTMHLVCLVASLFVCGRAVALGTDEQALIESATVTGQQPNGNIAFVVPDDVADKTAYSWGYKPSRWGRYAVYATYRIEGTVKAEDVGNVRVSVTIGDTELVGEGSPVSTDVSKQTTANDPAASRHVVSLGEYYLTEQKPFSMKAELQVGDGVSNSAAQLVALSWIPTCEGSAPVQQADGSILLHSRDSTVRGTVLRYEPKAEKNTLGYWIKQADAGEWKFEVVKPGTFSVEVLQGCGKGQGGSDVRITMGDQHLDFVVEETGHFQNFVPRVVGTLRIDQPGLQTLVIQPTKIKANAAMDIRQIRLIPNE